MREAGSVDLIDQDRLVAKRLLKGDEGAFRDVFDRFFPRLYRYALARVGGNGDEAREIVQMTFCRIFERIDSYRGEASLYGWACRICHNVIVDQARRQKRDLLSVPLHDVESTLHEIADAMCTQPAEPEGEVMQLNLRRLIQVAVDHLPARYADVLEWKYIEGLSVIEIAAKLDVGPKAAESLLTRARRAFREAIIALGDASDVLPEEFSVSFEG
jgi:RNA polymerase sigma-70 factor (ECF subfamily)